VLVLALARRVDQPGIGRDLERHRIDRELVEHRSGQRRHVVFTDGPLSGDRRILIVRLDFERSSLR
jgi:hypothetical protein